MAARGDIASDVCVSSIFDTGAEMLRGLTLLICLFTIEGLAYSGAAEWGPLSGLTQIQLLINIKPIDPSVDKACTASETEIRGDVMNTAGSAKFRIVPDKPQGMILISIGVANTPGPICVFNVHMAVISAQIVQFSYSEKLSLAATLLWDSTYMVLGNPSHTGGEVKKIIESMTKTFIGEWNLQNK